MSIIEKAARRLAENRRKAQEQGPAEAPAPEVPDADPAMAADAPTSSPLPGNLEPPGTGGAPAVGEEGRLPDAAEGEPGSQEVVPDTLAALQTPDEPSVDTPGQPEEPEQRSTLESLFPHRENAIEERPGDEGLAFDDAGFTAQESTDLGEWAFSDITVDDSNIVRITEIERGLLLSPDEGRTRSAEEFRLIKRPLLVKAVEQRAEAGRHSNLIMVTSAVQSEGKTFISLNLAISIAMEMDSTLLLVDADVAKPGLSKLLGVFDRPGLIEQLTDEHDDLSELLLRTDIPKLTVLPAGERHKRSTELLASTRMQRLLDELASRYSDRIVLFDSPPLLESTEAAVLASQMGQVVMVVESEVTSQMLVKEALAQFESLDNVSLILNKCKENFITNLMSGKYSGYGYGYGYGYGSDAEG